MSRPLFISFEGIDGAGKSTHIEAVAALLRQAGRTVVVTREPGGTPLAEKLRACVLNDAMDPLTEALLLFAARRDHIAKVIGPALQRGDDVLCDRFTDATFAYQGHGHGFDLTVLSKLEHWIQSWSAVQADSPPKTGILQPDLTLWFDVAPEIAAARLSGVRLPDRFEAQPVEFFRRVAAGYAARMEHQPARFARIDAAQTPDGVRRDALAAVQARLEAA